MHDIKDAGWASYVPVQVLDLHGPNPAMQPYIQDFRELEKHVGGTHGICFLFEAISRLEAERATWKQEVEDQKAYVHGLESRLADALQKNLRPSS